MATSRNVGCFLRLYNEQLSIILTAKNGNERFNCRVITFFKMVVDGIINFHDRE